MASSSSSLLIFTIACCFVSAISQRTCSSQNLSTAAPFNSCLDLPSLKSYLHYTYNASNSSLSVAFVATPSVSNGWVAWAINPTGNRMPGSQTFLAYRSRDGAAPTVQLYNITTYGLSGNVSRLSFDFWNLRAESLSDGRIAIFATVKLRPGANRVNQLWQIGGTVTNGVPAVHPMTPDNLGSSNVLRFTDGASTDAPSSAPGFAPLPPTSGSTTPGQPGAPGNGGSVATNVNFGVNLVIMVLLGCILIL